MGCWWTVFAPRRRVAFFCTLLLSAIILIIFFTTNSHHVRENELHNIIAEMKSQLDYLETQYKVKHEDISSLQTKLAIVRANISETPPDLTPEYSPEVQALLLNMTGTRAAAGIRTKHLHQLRAPYVFQLLPHLMNDPRSLKPAYLLSSNKDNIELVIGVPTVKRDKENYLLVTLSYLVDGLSAEDMNVTLIVVMIGETDLEYVLKTAQEIESVFPKHIEEGVIEIISPSPEYYPDMENLPLTLGDSEKRVKWRTKQNLDTIYLMAYSYSKGTLYLMLEDDVMAQKDYAQIIRSFTASTTASNPGWVFIEYCHVGGIGKVFRSSDLMHFLTYVQLFYKNMPIDWLLESYLADKTCALDKLNFKCSVAKGMIKPRYKNSLFQHIGVYSSLKGKIQKVKELLGPKKNFFPHKNPPIGNVYTNIREVSDHTLKKAYDGLTFFWGKKPKKNDTVEFWFSVPTLITRYLFRSGNTDHLMDKFRETVVEVLPSNPPTGSNFSVVGSFDEFGIAEGMLNIGTLSAIRLRLLRDSLYWVILSEIDLKPSPEPLASR